jgi:phosphatidylinositol glycan class A protein
MKRDVAVALVSDFFFPSLGGVEVHIKEMSKVLKEKVRKVIVVTHCYPPDYYGVRYIDGVKTYYLPSVIIATSNISFPNYVTDYAQAKSILVSEGIDIVHTHQSTSPLGIAFGVQGYHLGLRVVLTEHSLFEFKKIDGIIIPWVLTPIHTLYDKFICVSRATRNNLIIRNKQPSSKTVVIPNSVETRFVSH